MLLGQFLPILPILPEAASVDERISEGLVVSIRVAEPEPEPEPPEPYHFDPRRTGTVSLL